MGAEFDREPRARYVWSVSVCKRGKESAKKRTGLVLVFALERKTPETSTPLCGFASARAQSPLWYNVVLPRDAHDTPTDSTRARLLLTRAVLRLEIFKQSLKDRADPTSKPAPMRDPVQVEFWSQRASPRHACTFPPFLLKVIARPPRCGIEAPVKQIVVFTTPRRTARSLVGAKVPPESEYQNNAS